MYNAVEVSLEGRSKLQKVLSIGTPSDGHCRDHRLTCSCISAAGCSVTGQLLMRRASLSLLGISSRLFQMR